MTIENDVAEAARRFLAAAWRSLEGMRVVPRSRFNPYMRVGYDYEGHDVSNLQEFVDLERLLKPLHTRFNDDAGFDELDFVNSYIFNFLEFVVAHLARLGTDLRDAAGIVDTAAQDLLDAIQADTSSVAAARVVSHMTTVDGNELEILGVRVVPLIDEASAHRAGLYRIIQAAIPGGANEIERGDLFLYAPPESVLFIRDDNTRPSEALGELSKKLERFMLLARLLHAGTCQSAYEVQGEAANIGRMSPRLIRFRGAGPGFGSPVGMLRRDVRLTTTDSERFEGLNRLIDLIGDDKPNAVISSFGMAFHKFQISFHAHAWYEQIVDLATAFEATMSGTATTDVILRLKMRAADLLSTSTDSPQSIFADVGRLYDIRSKLVHGGTLGESTLRKTVYGISAVPDDAPFGVALGHAVDRLRDLVRRSLLVRICLATGDDPVWPIGNDGGVDAMLISDGAKMDWRHACFNTLESIGARTALERPAQALLH